MEVDTGASASIISKVMYHKLWPSTANLRTYSGEKLRVQGMIEVEVKYEDQVTQLPLLVVEGSGPSLLGRDWLLKINLDWKSLNLYHIENVMMPPKLNNLLAKHMQIFENELGLIKSIKAKIHLDTSCQPRFCKPRSIPYALCDRVETVLERLTKAGVIEATEFSDLGCTYCPSDKA